MYIAWLISFFEIYSTCVTKTSCQTFDLLYPSMLINKLTAVIAYEKAGDDWKTVISGTPSGRQESFCWTGQDILPSLERMVQQAMTSSLLPGYCCLLEYYNAGRQLQHLTIDLFLRETSE
jgi:hypothetical protein